jgi:polysaccharide chain length determinant protein (PEP-CTERM system associated)
MKSDIKFYWRMILRRLPIMMSIIILFSAMGLVQAIRLPASFQTEARLLVESPQISDELVDVTVTTSPDEEITIIRERLITRANILEIADRFDVYENYAEMTPDRIVERMRESTQIESQGGRNQATVITVGFEARSGQIAADVVNEYVTRIINANVELRTERAEGTLDFFEQEVQRLSSELGERSARISQFQAENADALPDDQAFRLNRQAVLQERVASAQRELSSLIDQRARIIEVYEATGQVTAVDDVLTDDQRQLRDLERELAQLLSIYSEDAPQVITLRRRIDTLREQVSATTADPAAQSNSAQAVLDLQLGQIDTQIETLEGIIGEAAAELVRLEDAIGRTPLNAITLESLQRDYENIRLQYDSAVARLAQASTGERIELTSRGQRITVIEAASVPDEPSSPNRRLIAAAGGMAGIGIAGLLFLILETLNRTVRRPVEITRALGIEPLATLPHISTRSERLGRIALRTAALLLVIGGLPAALWAVDTYYIPLDQLTADVLARLGLA